MYPSLRLRSEQSLEDLCDAFRAHTALDRLIFPPSSPCEEFLDLGSAGCDMATGKPRSATSLGVHTTASAPSLRQRVPVEEMDRPMTPDDGAGHVKVVVRCRKFIKRGSSGLCAQRDIQAIADDGLQRSRNSRHV